MEDVADRCWNIENWVNFQWDFNVKSWKDESQFQFLNHLYDAGWEVIVGGIIKVNYKKYRVGP